MAPRHRRPIAPACCGPPGAGPIVRHRPVRNERRNRRPLSLAQAEDRILPGCSIGSVNSATNLSSRAGLVRAATSADRTASANSPPCGARARLPASLMNVAEPKSWAKLDQCVVVELGLKQLLQQRLGQLRTTQLAERVDRPHQFLGRRGFRQQHRPDDRLFQSQVQLGGGRFRFCRRGLLSGAGRAAPALRRPRRAANATATAGTSPSSGTAQT